MIKKIPLEEFKKIYSKVPRLCVDLLIFENNQVLLTKRKIPPNKNWWHFPGGTVLLNESLRQTARRVAKEELNTEIKIKKTFSVLEYDQGSGLGQPISIVFLVEPLEQKLTNSKQAKEIKYFKGENLPKKTLPEVKKFLAKIENKSKNGKLS